MVVCIIWQSCKMKLSFCSFSSFAYINFLVKIQLSQLLLYLFINNNKERIKQFKSNRCVQFERSYLDLLNSMDLVYENSSSCPSFSFFIPLGSGSFVLRAMSWIKLISLPLALYCCYLPNVALTIPMPLQKIPITILFEIGMRGRVLSRFLSLSLPR